MNDIFYIISVYVFERYINITVSLYILVYVLNMFLFKVFSVWFFFNVVVSLIVLLWLIWLFLRFRVCNVLLDFILL